MKIKILLTSCMGFAAILLFSLIQNDVKAYSKEISINEVCKNFSLIDNGQGEYFDYIELYNSTETALNLNGYSLTDNRKELQKFKFQNQIIEPHNYILVYTVGQENSDQSNQAACFKLKPGETLYLTDEDEKVIDYVQIPELAYNTSYGRKSDGEAEWIFESSTPGENNAKAEELQEAALDKPVFLVKSGFYNEPFMLDIQGDGKSQIRYTIDSSEPDRNSALYTEPLYIDNVCESENIYSARTDISAGFFEEDDRYAVPEEPVDKVMVVRAAAFSADGKKKSETVTESYFIGYDKKAYMALPVISLVTDPDCLFDEEKGIYVSGKCYEEFVESGARNAMREPDNWRRWEANYTQHGREWERPVHIDYFDGNKDLVCSQDAGIRIKGGATRSFTQKSLNLYAREIYGGKKKFEPAFFGDKGAYSVTLFSGANDYKMKIRDVLISNACRDRAFSNMESVPCYVFLDGEYWGIYHLTEKYDDNYIKENYGVDPDNVVMIKANELECGKQSDYELFTQMNQYIEQADFEREEDYSKICSLIDMQSFIDYYGTEIYIARCEDWPGLNEAMWRSRDIFDKKYEDGKWRFMLYDVNWASGGLSNSLTEKDSIAYACEKSALFGKLMKNEQFRKAFTLTFCDLANTCFSQQKIIPQLDMMAMQMYQPMIEDFKRFYGVNRCEKDFTDEVADLKLFLQNRKGYIMAALKKNMQLSGELEPVTIKVNDSQGGIVKINTSYLEMQDGQWCGDYYTDYPIELKAIPNDGYEFVEWDGAAKSEENEISLPIESGKNMITAIFRKK